MDKTAAEIRAELQRLQDLPTPVSDWDVEVGEDSTNDPAVWVYVILEREDVNFATTTQIRDRVTNTVETLTKQQRWVYIRFRTALEVEQLKQMK